MYPKNDVYPLLDYFPKYKMTCR